VTHRSVAALALLFALGCTKEIELRAIYANLDGKGAVFPCDSATREVAAKAGGNKAMWRVHDSALNAAYLSLGGGRMYVRAYGTTLDSGSIYGSYRTFLVRQILEIRAAKPGECFQDSVALTMAPLQGKPVNPEIAATLVPFVQRFYDWYVPLMLRGKAFPFDVTLKQHATPMDSGLVQAL